MAIHESAEDYLEQILMVTFGFRVIRSISGYTDRIRPDYNTGCMIHKNA